VVAVIGTLVNRSDYLAATSGLGADAKAGLAWTFVFAGNRKIDANGHEPLSERARATIQADVNNLYTQLCGLVAANRCLTNEAMQRTPQSTAASSRSALVSPYRVETLDLATEMAAELDRAAPPARSIINPTPKRNTSVAKSNTEQVVDDTAARAQAAPQAPAPNPEPAPPPIQAPAAAPEPVVEPDPAERLREEIC
jgi:ClpP class serine protease